jgi:2-polyprenyl-3-methyl-5-hydroxy-6-metoxy-1,4-benzoquinol methylase
MSLIGWGRCSFFPIRNDPDMTRNIQGRLDVNWDSYWNGFIKIPLIEPLRSYLIKRACDRLLRSFKPQGEIRICELGAGTGTISLYLANRYAAQPVLVDNNPHAYKLSQETFKDFKGKWDMVRRDVFDLKEYAGQFDLVHSGGLIEHFVDSSREEIIKAHTDLVKPGSYVMILVPVVNIWYRMLNYGVFKFLHLLDEIPEVPWTYNELKEALSRNGFEIISKTTVISEIGVLARKSDLC